MKKVWVFSSPNRCEASPFSCVSVRFSRRSAVFSRLSAMLLFFVQFLYCGPATAQESFQTPEWKTVPNFNVRTWPSEMSDQMKVTPGEDCVVLDASSLEKSADFRNIQLNVPGIDAEAVQDKTFLFTLEIDGPKGAALNLYLEGCDRDGNFMAVMLQRGGGNSLILRGGRETARFLTHLPDGIRELHWRFDFFKAGVYRLFRMNAEFIPEPEALHDGEGKPELLFYVPFDGSTKPSEAAGNPEPLVSENIVFCEGIKGKAADFSSKEHSRLSYELAKNLRREQGAISVWMKRNSVEKEEWRTIFTLPWDSDSRIGSGALWFWLWGGRLRFDTSDVLDSCIVSDLPEMDGWIHVAASWNPFERYVYINGKCVLGNHNPEKRLEPQLPLVYHPRDYDRFDVGNYRGYNTLDGKLDELKIFSAPLSDADVLELYRQERPLGMRAEKRYFYEDAPTAISGFVENYVSRELPVSVHLRDAEGKEIAEPLNLKVSGGDTSFMFPVRKFPAGDFFLSLEQQNGEKAAELGIHVFRSPVPEVSASEVTASEVTASEELTLETVENIDPLALGADRLTFAGTHSVGELNGRKYLQAGPGYEERFAVKLPKMEPDALYCLDVEIPDDCQRTVDIIAQNAREPRSSEYELHSGYLTGDEYPCMHRFLTQRLLFRARSAENALLFMTARSGEGGAAVAQIRVSRVTEPLPAVKIQEAEPLAGWTRPVGVYFEDCALGYDFGANLETPGAFETTMNRLCEYMRFTGQNMLTYPVVWYNGRIGKEYPARPHVPEYFDAMLTMFDREKFSFMASVNQYRVLFPTPQVTRKNLKDGSLNDSPYMIHSDGFPNKTHSISLFHPDVQAMMNRYVDEILAEGVKHPSFKGISFHMVFNNLTTFGDLKMGYNDYLIEEFEKDTGILIPVNHATPDRGKLYADWLLANARESWVEWRCQKMARWYKSLAQKLADARPDLRLVLNCKVAIGYQKNFGLPGEFTGMRDYWERANREMGIDAKYYKDSPNIIIEQTVFPADYRWMSGRSDETVRETLRLTETRPGMYGTLRDAEIPWLNMHDRYWESPVGNPARNPSFKNQFHADWLSEHPWRVSTLNPTGFYALRHYVLPLRYCDIQGFNKGGFLIGTLGMEEPLREFARAFRTLPAVKFEDVAGSSETVRVRQYSDGKNTWFYVVNTSETPVRVTLAPGVSLLRNTGRNETLTLDGPSVTLSLPPYRLECFRAEGQAAVSVIKIE